MNNNPAKYGYAVDRKYREGYCVRGDGFTSISNVGISKSIIIFSFFLQEEVARVELAAASPPLRGLHAYSVFRSYCG